LGGRSKAVLEAEEVAELAEECAEAIEEEEDRDSTPYGVEELIARAW
jgi:hypothetical protein